MLDIPDPQIARRHLSDRDAQTLTSIGIASLKIGVAAIALVAAGPVAATTFGALALPELTGILMEGKKARLVDFISHFSRRTAEIPTEAQERIRVQLGTEAGSRIFEAAWYQAALLTNSLSSDELEEHQTRWLLQLLDQIDVVEIVILQSKLQANENEYFKNKYASIFLYENEPEKPGSPPRGRPLPGEFYGMTAPLSEEQQREWNNIQEKYQIAREKHSLFQSRFQHMVGLGLLGVGQNRRNRSGYEVLTPLGAALLKIIAVAETNEYGLGESTNAVQLYEQAESREKNWSRAESQRTQKQQELEKQTEKEAYELARQIKNQLGI